ncbi:MAG: hypothetical protein IPI53_10045 [Saprospiraceae bacterium]|nr:hypothetical protein [Saprospiraceae bacterium]
MKTIFLTTMIVLLTTFFSAFNVCQAQNPYGEVNFIKTLPNMSESFLIDMKTSKNFKTDELPTRPSLPGNFTAEHIHVVAVWIIIMQHFPYFLPV